MARAVTPILFALLTLSRPLFAADCVDPDRTRIPQSVSLTLCDGTLAHGELDVNQLQPERIASGIVIGGVTGTAPVNVLPCAHDGQIGCMATSAYVAADAHRLMAGHIKVGVMIGGIQGNYDATKPACSNNGEIGCITTATYQAADLSNLVAANVRNGATVAGVSGIYPSASAPLDGADATVDLTTLDAATSAGSYEFFDSIGTRYTGMISDAGTITPGATPQSFATSLYRAFTIAGDNDLNAANIKSGVTIFGVTGGLNEAPVACSSNGQTGCVTTATYQAADLSNLVPGNVRSAMIVAGVTGDYPSATHPLIGASGSVADLTSFAATNGGTTYEWFHADGTRLTGTVESNAVVSPSATSQLLDAGLYRSVTVNGDPDLLPGNIRSGVTIFGLTGSLVPSTPCTSDQQTGCVVSGAFKAADASRLIPSNIKAGVAFGGITGSLTGAPANCSANNETGCVTTSTYRAADLSNLLAENVKNGVTIAGVAGTYPSGATPLSANTGMQDLTSLAATTPAGIYEFFDSTGARFSGTIADIGAISVSATSQTFNGAAYRGFTVPGDGNFIASHVRSGTEIFEVTGTLAPAPAACASDGSTGCVTNATYKAADIGSFNGSDLRVGKTVASVVGTLDNCASDGGSSCVVDGITYRAARLVNFSAADVRSGMTIAGVTGSANMESHTDCGADGLTGCLSTTAFPAVHTGTATVGNIKAGVVLAGVTGQFPSATHTLAGASGTADLENASFHSQIVSATPFEYWDSAGTRHIGSGDADIVPQKISNGTTIFATAGSGAPEGHSACASDGASGCYTDGTNYKAARLANFAPGDVKTGVIIAGVSGTATLEGHASCATEGAGSCVVDGTTYKAASTAAAVAGNIRSGVSLGGATGAYPSASYPLAGADGTSDLDSATFTSQIKSAATFEWFDADGTRYAGAGDADIQAENIAKDISIFGTVGTSVPSNVCGTPGDGCYEDAAALAAGAVTTPSGKDLVYVTASGGFKVWKDAGSDKILRANGMDEWAMKLNPNGKGQMAAGNEFTSYTSIVGRVCPPNVYIDATNRTTSGNCLYYTTEPAQALNRDGTNGIAGFQYGTMDWYTGNVQVCSSKGMRLPLLFETTTTTTASAGYPTSFSPTFATTNGIPSHPSGYTWTTTGGGGDNIGYYNWSGTAVTNNFYSSSKYVRCVLP